MATDHRWSPLQGAFTFTALAAAFVIAGSAGYEIRRSGGVPVLRPAAGIVWEEVWWGIGAAVVAAAFWIIGLRSAGRAPRTPPPPPRP